MCPDEKIIDENTSNNDDSEWIDLALTEDYVQLFNEQNLLSTILSNKLKNGKDGGLLADQRYAMKYYYGQFLAHTLAYELSKPENDNFELLYGMYYVKNMVIGESIKFTYINQPKVDAKVDNNYKLLELVITTVHELMYACQANTNDKTKSYYGMLTSMRDKATSIWSLSDKVWYTCRSFLAVEIHDSNDYLQSFKLLQEELKDICSAFNNSSGIYTKLQDFLEKDLNLLLSTGGVDTTKADTKADTKQGNKADTKADTKQDNKENKIDRSPVAAVSFLRSRFEESSSSVKDIATSSNSIPQSSTKRGAA